MPPVFADAGYWIALWDPEDSLHEHAAAIAADVGSDPIVTTQLVLIEALNYMSGRGEFRRRLAARMVNELEEDPGVEVVHHSPAEFRAALERYVSRSDQTWGLTDCVSFLVMEERRITEALAYDRDFEQAGYVALLRGDQDS